MQSFVRPTPLTDKLYDYALSVGLREPEQIRALREETAKLPDAEWQIAPEQGPLIALLVQLMGAKNCLEIGTFTGYSAAWTAAALPRDGMVVCCEVNDTFAEVAHRHWQGMGLTSKIDLRMGPALRTIESLLAGGWLGLFDMAFIDADKANYDAYYEHCLRLVRRGGLIMIDNTLWDGKVADPDATDPDTVAIRTLNAKIHADERVFLCFLPFADGLTLCMKR